MSLFSRVEGVKQDESVVIVSVEYYQELVSRVDTDKLLMYCCMVLCQVNSQLLVNINSYIWKLMKMFGVPFGDKSSSGDQVGVFVLMVTVGIFLELI